MSERNAAHLWAMRLIFLGLCLGVLFFQLLPLETVPRRWTGPDLLLVLCVAWSLRRPDFVPPLLIALIMLMADFLYQRPPGPFAALTVFVCHRLYRRAVTLRDAPYFLEWLTASGAMLAVVLGNRVVLSVFIVDQAPLGLTLIQLIMSVLAYPLVTGGCALLGLSRAALREIDGLGGRA